MAKNTESRGGCYQFICSSPPHLFTCKTRKIAEEKKEQVARADPGGGACHARAKSKGKTVQVGEGMGKEDEC